MNQNIFSQRGHEQSPRDGAGVGRSTLPPATNSATISSGPEVRQDPGSTIQPGSLVHLHLDVLTPSAVQPRQHFDQDALNELAVSIEHYGVLQPLLVKPTATGVYEILAGERRWRAARQAGLKSVPCLVRSTEDNETLEIALIENIHRRDLTPIEEARALSELISHHQYTHEELSNRLGIPRTSLSNTLRLLSLSAAIQEKVHSGQLSTGHAKAILSLSTASAREMLADLVVSKDLSVRRTEQLAKSMESEKNAGLTAPPQISPNLRHLCDQYKGHLGTKVKITGNQERGRIEISYYSQEDLDRITELVLGPGPI
jgi:ParB family chromosome partitioning protein